MNKKTIWSLLLLILLLVACGSGEEEATPAPETEIEDTATAEQATPPEPADESQAQEVDVEPVTIRFAVFDFELGRYDDLIDAFEEENPDIKIKPVSVEEILEIENLTVEWPEDARLRLVSAADVSTIFYNNESARQGYLLDLDPLIEADPNFNPNDFYPNLLESYQFDGGTWAVPTEANFILIFFDKDAFDAAGIPYPDVGWSWDDFLAAAQALTNRDGDEVSQWGFAEISSDPEFFVTSRTGPLFDMEADPPTPKLDDPDVADMMRWYTDLYLVHQVAPYFPEPEEGGGLNIPEGYSIIESGQAAMWWDSASSWPIRSQQANLGVVPFPVDTPDAATTRLIPSGLSISAGSANPEAAWRWVDFLSRQTSELGIGFFEPTSVPARQSGAEAGGFWDDVDPELGQALQYALEHSYVPSAPPGGIGPFYEAFQAIMAGEKTVEEALADAQLQSVEGIEERLAESGDEDEEIVVSETESDTPANEDAVTVEFIAGAGPFELQSFRDLAKTFQEANPDVIMEVKSPDFFSGTPSISDIAAASDCFHWFPGGFNDPDTVGALLSLDPFLDADPNLGKEDFFPVILDSFTAQGQTWGLPGQANVTLVEYNKDLFDEADLEYPSPDWTTEEFLTLAVALTQGEGENKQFGYVSNLFEPTDLLSFLDRFGVELIDESSDPPALNFTSPELIDTVRWFTSLTTEYEVKPVLMKSLTDIAVSAVEDREALLNQGQAAMWTNSSVNVTFGEESENTYQTGAVPLPTQPGGPVGSGFSSASGYFISSGTEVREACWRWISFLTEQPNIGTGLPARPSVAESEAYRQHVGPELAEAYLTSIASADRPPFSQQISDENSWMNFPIIWLYNIYGQILDGEFTVEEALDNAQQLADAYRACVIDAGATNDEDGQRACMLEIDETIPPYLLGG